MRVGSKPKTGGGRLQSGNRYFSRKVWSFLALAALLFTSIARAELQFDVKMGFEGTIREANWFPVAFEIFNDGPPISGVIELTNEQAGRGQARRIPVELPTNTRKRIVVPVFASAGKYAHWKAVLYDDREKARAEVKNLSTRKDLPFNGMMIGSMSRSFGGQPIIPDVTPNQNERGAEVVRLDPVFLPDGPIALDALQTIYLNSERALEISAQQGVALVSWLQAGGHLIVGVEQPGDLSGLPWLAPLMPVRFNGSLTVPGGRQLDNFAWSGYGPGAENYVGTGRKKEDSTEFRESTMPVFPCEVKDGLVQVSAGDVPLVVRANRGRGQLTVLTFSPEREPFRTWKGRNWFWAQLAGVPAAWFKESNQNNNFGYMSNQSIDGPIGAMIDSKQVRKLPVSWLLLLLAVYLVVIGPLDQWWLKKINRQMLTWVTFPCYVIGFSLLIYWIGFLLRAGESEWNELHVVDVMAYNGKADLRGRTYASCYSPSNSRYPVATDVAHATFRGEFQGSWASPQELSRSEVTQLGKGFAAEIFVPVWTSQLYVSDWAESAAEPLTINVTKIGLQYTVRIENKLQKTVDRAWVVLNDRVTEVSKLAPGERKVITIMSGSGQRLEEFVAQNTQNFYLAAERRRDAFGSSQGNYLPNPPQHVAAASFMETVPTSNNGRQQFMMPAGFDLSSTIKNDQACLLAWVGSYAPIPELNKFNPRRATRDTLFRVMAPVAQ